jgi:hypothetical protein
VDLNGAADELVRGVGLSNSSPFLEIGSRKVGPNTKTDSEMRFSMPAHSSVVGKPLLFPAVLHLYERHTKYVFWSDYVERTYPIRLAVYRPSQAGRSFISRHSSEYKRSPTARVFCFDCS